MAEHLEIEALEEVRKPHVERRAEHRPPERVDAADDEHDEDPEAKLDRVVGGLRVAVPMDGECTGERTDGGAKHEHREPQPQSRHSETAGDRRLVTERDRLALHRRACQPEPDEHGERDRTEVDPEEVPLVGGNALDLGCRLPAEQVDRLHVVELRTVDARELVPLGDDLVDDLAECEGRDREEEQVCSTCHPCECKRDHRGDGHAERDRDDEVQVLACRPRGGVAAHHRECRLRERELPGEAEDEVEADDHHGVDEPQVEEERLVVSPRRDEPEGHDEPQEQTSQRYG